MRIAISMSSWNTQSLRPKTFLIHITAWNRGPEDAPLWIAPITLVSQSSGRGARRTDDPRVVRAAPPRNRAGALVLRRRRNVYGKRWLICEGARSRCSSPKTKLISSRIFNSENRTPYVKDAFTNTSSIATRRRESRGRRARAPPQSTSTIFRPAHMSPFVCDSPIAIQNHSPRSREIRGDTRSAQHSKRLFEQRIKEADEFYTSAYRDNIQRRRAQRDAPGVRGTAVVQAVLPLRRGTWLDGDPGTAAATAGTKKRTQSTTGRIFTTRTFFRCPTNGNFRGLRPGTWRFTRSLWRWSIRISRRSN